MKKLKFILLILSSFFLTYFLITLLIRVESNYYAHRTRLNQLLTKVHTYQEKHHKIPASERELVGDEYTKNGEWYCAYQTLPNLKGEGKCELNKLSPDVFELKVGKKITG